MTKLNKYLFDLNFDAPEGTSGPLAGSQIEADELPTELIDEPLPPSYSEEELTLARDQAFAYHMWTEIAIDGRWLPLDATMAQGGIGPAHLKLAHSNLKGATAFSSFLPVVQVVGQLSILVEEEQ